MEKIETDWKRMSFKKNKVWMATDDQGRPVVKNGKVLIKYQLDQNYEYWVHENSVKPIDTSQFKEEKAAPKKRAKKLKPQPKIFEGPVPDNAIIIYTDGASSGNPGPSGIGVLMQYGNHEKKLSKYIGIATNNIAELEAIKAALLELKKTDLPVRIYTDSSYAHGLLALNWKARKNYDLVSSIKKLISKFHDLKLVKVEGHAGIDGNEQADMLATSAIKQAEIKK